MATPRDNFIAQFTNITRAARLLLMEPSEDIEADCVLATALLMNVQVFFSRDQEKLTSNHLLHLSDERRKIMLKLLKDMLLDIVDLKAAIFLYKSFPALREQELVVIRQYFEMVTLAANICVMVYQNRRPAEKQVELVA